MKTLRITTHKQIFYLLIAITVIIIAVGVFKSRESALTARPDTAGQPAAPRTLAAPKSFFNFGNVSMAAGRVSHRFRIRNTGSAAVTVTMLYTSCMCTEATLITPAGKKGPFGMAGHGTIRSINERIAPGTEALVEVVFDPAAHGLAGLGPVERIVTVKNDAGRPVELRFRATVRP